MSEHTERPPERGAQNPDESTADPQDFFVKRDSSGELQTTTAYADPFGDIEIVPMTYGDAEDYFGDAGRATMVGPDVIAEVIGNHVTSPDLDEWVRSTYSEYPGFTGQVVANEMNPMAPQALLLAIMRESGIDPSVEMTSGGSAEIAFEQEGN